MQRLAKLAKKHRNGQIPKVDWLDRLTFREIEMINEREKNESENMYLLIEFPTVLCEQSNQTVSFHEQISCNKCTFSNNIHRIFYFGIQYSIVYFEPDGELHYKFNSKPKLVTVPDTEIMQVKIYECAVLMHTKHSFYTQNILIFCLQDNLVERKHHRLARSARSGLSDRDAKPTAAVRDQLQTIVSYPPTTALTSEEQDLVWKYRFYLTSHKKALTKFLKCINWETQSEVRQAINLLKQWTPMDVEDALELLSPAFTHPVVRR